MHKFVRDGPEIENELEEALEQLEINPREAQKFDVTTDEAILASQTEAAAAVITFNEMCWICQLNWNEFTDLRLITRLHCQHLACSSCLLRMLKNSSEKQKDAMGEFNFRFECGICRLELDETIPYETAESVLNKGLVPSLSQFIMTGPSKDERRERRRLVYSLLVDQFEYDVARVEATLFNLLEIINCPEPTQLSSGMFFVHIIQFLIDSTQINL